MRQVLLADPEIARIPVQECGEPLVDLREVQALRVDPRLADADGNYARLRLGVADRLVTAQALLPPGLRLLVVEGYRPMSLQRRYFEAHKDRLRAEHPGRDEAWFHRQASRYISPPDVAPHVAGAAVDLTMSTVDGVELDLGTAVDDTNTDTCHTDSPRVTREAREYRNALRAALEATGLVNYPSEWWHWSYGDRYWAYTTGAGTASYGPLDR